MLSQEKNTDPVDDDRTLSNYHFLEINIIDRCYTSPQIYE